MRFPVTCTIAMIRFPLTLLCVIVGLSAQAEDRRLADAVEQQDSAAIRSLLDQQVEVNGAQPDGMTALNWAVFLEDAEMVKILLDAGADANCKNNCGVMPLSIACQHGNESIVKRLLANGADPDSALRGGETALMTAARTGRVGPVAALLETGAEFNAVEEEGQTALMWAAAEGHADVVEMLVGAGANYDVVLPSGFTALMFAVRQGHIDVVHRLIAEGADVKSAMRPSGSSQGKSPGKGMSPLLLAIENGHFQLAAELLRAGANPKDDRTGFTPLHAISWVRKPAIGDNEYGDPPPIGSGRLTSLALVDLLIDHGAEVNAKKKDNGKRGKFGKKNSTPFLLAAGTADVPLMKKLLEHGADPTIRNSIGWTPLMFAAGIGSGPEGDEPGTKDEALDAVKFLLDIGADIDAVDKDGETAMHGAAYKMAPRVAEFLAQRGADVNIWSKKSEKGRTPLSIAQGYRPGNFKPSYETVDMIAKLMIANGVTPPPPPADREDPKYGN
jgi:ankyrin repeat protein